MSLNGCSTLVVRVINNHSPFFLENKVHYLPGEIMQVRIMNNNPKALICIKEWKHKLELNSILLGKKITSRTAIIYADYLSGSTTQLATGFKARIFFL